MQSNLTSVKHSVKRLAPTSCVLLPVTQAFAQHMCICIFAISIPANGLQRYLMKLVFQNAYQETQSKGIYLCLRRYGMILFDILMFKTRSLLKRISFR